MFDRIALKITKPLINAMAERLVSRGFSADQITFTAFGLGLASALMIGFSFTKLALIPLLAGRILDGLDGAVARLDQPSDVGAFLDITLDFLFYASIPLAFVLSGPAENAVAGAVLLVGFIGTGTSFLAYAIMAEKRGEKNQASAAKSFYYLGGLTEGTETIACFAAMCWWPQHFAALAYFYAALCGVTTLTRVMAGWRQTVTNS